MTYPDDRPVAYDPDKLWDEDTQTWYAIGTVIGSARAAQAGGRLRQQLVVVSNQGNIFFGEG